MLAAVGIPIFMVTLDNLVVTTALPVIRTELGASLTDLQWFVNAYTLPFAAFLLTAAALGDRLGRRRMFIGGIVALHPRLGRRRAWPPSRGSSPRPARSRAWAARRSRRCR